MSKHSHMYNNERWEAIRTHQLQIEPLCRMCKDQGEYNPATVCDHIEPHKGNWTKFWSGPFQSLCSTCHSSDKQIIENGGTPRPRIGLDGWPVEKKVRRGVVKN